MKQSALGVMLAAGLFAAVAVPPARAAQQPPAPVPQPFPQTGGQTSEPPPSSAQPSAAPAPQTSQVPPPAGAGSGPAAATPGSSLAATLGLPVYPSAQFLASYDAGRGQRYYLFGSTAPFDDLVAYYRSVLKRKGTLVFDTPATYMFEVGKFDQDTMAFPPGVTIKDFQSSLAQGYPNPKPGGQPAFFPTIIQIVPAPAPQVKP